MCCASRQVAIRTLPGCSLNRVSSQRGRSMCRERSGGAPATAGPANLRVLRTMTSTAAPLRAFVGLSRCRAVSRCTSRSHVSAPRCTTSSTSTRRCRPAARRGASERLRVKRGDKTQRLILAPRVRVECSCFPATSAGPHASPGSIPIDSRGRSNCLYHWKPYLFV